MCSAHFSFKKNTVLVPLAVTASLEFYESEAMLVCHFSAVVLDGLSYQVSPLLAWTLKEQIPQRPQRWGISCFISRRVYLWASLVPAMQDTQVRPLDREEPLKKGMASHSSILSWRIPWTEEPGGLQSTGYRLQGHKQLDTTEAT